jgi:uncharacterized protein HemX
VPSWYVFFICYDKIPLRKRLNGKIIHYRVNKQGSITKFIQMENSNIPVIAIVIVLGLALVIFLFWKNQKDKKELNPSGPDAVTEEKTDAQNERDRV